MVMVFKATFNNMSAISVLLMKENGVHPEKTTDTACHLQTLSYNVVSRTDRHDRDSNLHL